MNDESWVVCIYAEEENKKIWHTIIY